MSVTCTEMLFHYVFQGRCTRENCKYLHPPPHLKTQLEINGRNNLIQQKTAAAMFAQQMQFMLPGAQLQPIVSYSSGLGSCWSRFVVCLLLEASALCLSSNRQIFLLLWLRQHLGGCWVLPEGIQMQDWRATASLAFGLVSSSLCCHIL